MKQFWADAGSTPIQFGTQVFFLHEEDGLSDRICTFAL